MPNHSETESATHSSSSESAASFDKLGRRISGWTSNLLAVTLLGTIGLALGWQLIGLFHDQPPSVQIDDVVNASVKLPLVPNEREFWTRGGLVKVQRQSGTPADALETMQTFCRDNQAVAQPRAIGPGEAAFVQELLAEQPLEESSPIALYQPPGQAAMVVAVDRNRKQIVAWSFAAPTPDGGWSLYHFRPK